MGRCNIKHPDNGMWRCWSTVVDDWVSDWLSEEDYKQWLIDEATRAAKEDIEYYGIKEPRFTTYEDCVYTKAFKEFCEKCPDRFEKCDTCDYNIRVEAYIAGGNDYLNTGLIKLTTERKESNNEK